VRIKASRLACANACPAKSGRVAAGCRFLDGSAVSPILRLTMSAILVANNAALHARSKGIAAGFAPCVRVSIAKTCRTMLVHNQGTVSGIRGVLRTSPFLCTG